MVVRISSGSRPSGAVDYNENKVAKGEAERLVVRNYESMIQPGQEVDATVFKAMLQQQADGNDRIKKPTIHISLSLAPGEKPDQQELIRLADRYMDGMGYGKQPYAVYQHHDTDHTHIHIVSVRVDENGKKISDKFEHERSNKLRVKIEKEFSLKPAEESVRKPEKKQAVPVEYGKGNLKEAIGEVVNTVLRDYKFSSFSQFNQLLQIYNVKAVEVAIEGKQPGLVYTALDVNKEAVGQPIPSSLLPYQPTKSRVDRRSDAGKKIKEDKVGTVRKVATAGLATATNWDSFQQNLSKQGIELVPHIGKGNNLFGVSFVDVKSRAIYTGSELGKAFTAGSLKSKLGAQYQPPTKREVAPVVEPQQRANKQYESKQAKPHNPDKKTYEKTRERQQEEPKKEVEPEQNADLIRNLINALNSDEQGIDSEHELKKMVKRRKPKR